MKISIILILLIQLFVNINKVNSQDTISQKSINIEADYIAFIPFKEVVFVDKFSGPDDFSLKHTEKYKLSLNNYAFKVCYRNKLYNNTKSSFYNIKIYYIHNAFKSIKEGGGGGGFTGVYFYGVSKDYSSSEYLAFDYSISNFINLSKNISFYNEIGVNINFLLFKKNYGTWQGTDNNNIEIYSKDYSSKEWFSLKKPYYNQIAYLCYYKFGVQFPINNKINLSPNIEIPIFLFNSFSNKWSDITPRSISPYYTSVKNMSVVNLRISLIYKI